MDPVTVPMIVGPFGPAQLACLRSWRALGLAPVFVQTEGPPQPWGLGGLVSAHAFRPMAELRTPAGAKWLAALVQRHGVTGLTCVADELALWLQREVALPEGTRCWLAAPAAIERLTSKAGQLALAQESGFSLLPTWRVSTVADIEAIPENAFPLVARPDTTPSVRPLFKVERFDGRTALAAFVTSRTQITRPMVLQPFRRGPNLLVHGWRRADGTADAYTLFEVPRKMDGVAVEIVARPADASLLNACRQFAARLGLHGVFHFDLLQDPATGQALFLEANGRLGGTTGKVTALGWDEPAALLHAHGVPGFTAPAGAVAVGRRGFNLQSALKYLARSLRGGLGSLDYPDAGRAEATAALLRLLATGQEEIGLFRAPRSALGFYAQRIQREG